MIKKSALLTSLAFGLPLIAMGCGPEDIAQDDTPVDPDNVGTLSVIADGESRLRDGFESKDGWNLSFNHDYVTFNNIEAHQTEPPFDANSDDDLEPTASATLLESPTTVDLVGEDPTPTVASGEAPAGMYNALYWEVVTAESGDAEGSTLYLEGTAEKDDRTVDFVISLDKPVAHTCGEYVGDERKGILEAGGEAELETTFHFDHFFGRADRGMDESPNSEAFGFEPFLEYADGDSINVASEQLQEDLDDDLYDTLVYSVTELGHVGEGHCRIRNLYL